MKRLFFWIFTAGMLISTTASAAISLSSVRKETRFLTDKMAHELRLTTLQYNDVYEINYDFIYTTRYLLDGMLRGEADALSQYYEILDIRNDDLRWVLSDYQYRRFLKASYFYRPIKINGRNWTFQVYINYPNRNLFYFDVPTHYYTYCGAHHRPTLQHVSFYRERYCHLHHYPTVHRVAPPIHATPHRRPLPSHPSANVRPHSQPEHRPLPSNKPDKPVYQRQEKAKQPSPARRTTRQSLVPDRGNKRPESSSRKSQRKETNGNKTKSILNTKAKIYKTLNI